MVYLVQTEHASAVTQDDSLIYVALRDRWVGKHPVDLNKGDRVRVSRDGSLDTALVTGVVQANDGLRLARDPAGPSLLVDSPPDTEISVQDAFDTYHLIRSALFTLSGLRNELSLEEGSLPLFVQRAFPFYVFAQLAPLETSVPLQFNQIRDAALAEGFDSFDAALARRYEQFSATLLDGGVIPSDIYPAAVRTLQAYSHAVPASWYGLQEKGKRIDLAQTRLALGVPMEEVPGRLRYIQTLTEQGGALYGHLTSSYGSLPTRDLFMDYHMGAVAKYRAQRIASFMELPSAIQVSAIRTLDVQVEMLLTNRESLAVAKDKYEAGGYRFFTEREVRGLLAPVGLEPLVAVYTEHTFI